MAVILFSSFSTVFIMAGHAQSVSEVLSVPGYPQVGNGQCNFGSVDVGGDDGLYDPGYPGATECRVLQVQGCPISVGSGYPGPVHPLAAWVVINTPTGTLNGTIVLLSGDGGTSFFNFPSGRIDGSKPTYAWDYYKAGFRVIQVAW